MKKIYYFSSTHWDREWYKPFQNFRMNLVDYIDEIIEYLESNEEFNVFHFDGQTIILEDYLEIKPENKERLTKLIQTERILIGPWYCMPDEFLVSGEALIRNLKIGYGIASAFKVKPWGVGYVCDIFGHIAQMPQILRGFHIDSALLTRGASDDATPAFFTWQSPDSSEVITFKTAVYGSFCLDVIGRQVFGNEIDADSDEFKELAIKYIESESKRTSIPIVVLMDGLDHEPIHKKTPQYIRRLKEIYPDCEVLHADLSVAFKEAKKLKEILPVRNGELYDSENGYGIGFAPVLTHTLSSRISIKDRNDKCQILLEKWLEPMSVFLADNGFEMNKKYLDIAWKYLLQNHPHDSICGCSSDRVHEEMKYRFSQVESIGEALLDKGLQRLSSGYKRCGEEGEYLCIVNPLPYSYRRSIEVVIPFEPQYPFFSEPFGYENIKAFRLFDINGDEIKYAVKEIMPDMVAAPINDTTINICNYKIIFETLINPMGITTIKIEKSKRPVRFFGSLATSNGGLDNGLISIGVNDDGTVNLLDYETNMQYTRLLGISDDGEIGDGWNSVRPKCDIKIISSKLLSNSVAIENPEYSEIRIVRSMSVPKKMASEEKTFRRSSEITEIKFVVNIGITKNSKKLDIKLKFVNDADDHRLRLLLPTGIKGEKYFANQAFSFVERKCGRDMNSQDYKEMDQLEKSMSGIVGKRDNTDKGLAFISKFGLHECGVDDDKNNTIYVTLLRSFGKVYYNNGVPGGQERGIHEYEFSILPLDKSISKIELQRYQDISQVGVMSFISDKIISQSYIEINGDILCSAIKLADDRSGDIIIRLYNPQDADVKFSFKTLFKPVAVYCCDMLENKSVGKEQPSISEDAINYSMEKYEIVTLRIKKY